MSTRTSDQTSELLSASRKIVQDRTSIRPDAAIILGSGLGGLAAQVQHPTAISFTDLPVLPAPSASGHAGKLILGYLGGLPVAVFQGRSHLYEGHSAATATAAVRLSAALGANLCIASNAAGGLNPRFRTGDLVAIDSHINFFFNQHNLTKSDRTFVSEAGNIDRSSLPLYDRALIGDCEKIALRLGFPLHRGTYLGTLGPTYETRAEYRAFRTMGADMVGMSTILEMLTAAQLGMRTLAFSVITNVANPDVPTKTTHDEVLDVANVAQQRLLPLVANLLNNLSGPPD